MWYICICKNLLRQLTSCHRMLRVNISVKNASRNLLLEGVIHFGESKINIRHSIVNIPKLRIAHAHCIARQNNFNHAYRYSEPEEPTIQPIDYSDEELNGYTFVDPLPEKYKCEICKSILKQPHATECCGKHFCEDCLKKSALGGIQSQHSAQRSQYTQTSLPTL